MTLLTIATYNIHKGLSHFNRRVVLHNLRDRLHELNPDIVFLQEVQGEKISKTKRNEIYPLLPQHEYLAHQVWPYHVYGKNAEYEKGHHGNAILSRFPIVRWENQDVSTHRFEKRGLLHCEVHLPGSKRLLHCLCVHFGLSARGRRLQFKALVERIRQMVPEEAPLIIAGDFNDWTNNVSKRLEHELQVHEAFKVNQGKLAMSYPVGMSLLRMDRIYVRGMGIQSSKVHAWRKISDHAALSTTLELV